MNPEEILKNFYQEASDKNSIFIADKVQSELIKEVCHCTNNRALTRLLLSCTLAKVLHPEYNVCMPYTEIGMEGCFSGRVFDEKYITQFVTQHGLPCNSTTAYLTPALRNITQPLSSDVEIAGNNRNMYRKAIQVLENIEYGLVYADVVLKEIIQVLINIRDTKAKRMADLLEDLKNRDDSLLPSSEAIYNLIFQHLQCRRVSRLPVLIIAAIYNAIGNYIGESIRPLNAHNAADLQTHSLGDVEICLSEHNDIVTVYEMKEKQVSINDIDLAVQKILLYSNTVHNYIFITTEAVNQDVQEYAFQYYEKTGGTEIVVLDCLGFLRYFLHFFHRQRVVFLDEYQKCVLNEPDSAVSAELKEAFLVLRKVLES